MIPIKFHLGEGQHPRVPMRAHDDDAGWDLFVSREAYIPAGRFIDVHTDISIELPRHLWARLVGRSSTSRRYGLSVQEGIIDSGYRGELFIGVWNHSHDDIKVEAGLRLVQLILMQHVPKVEQQWMETEHLTDSARGNKGFGSSGQ